MRLTRLFRALLVATLSLVAVICSAAPTTATTPGVGATYAYDAASNTPRATSGAGCGNTAVHVRTGSSTDVSTGGASAVSAGFVAADDATTVVGRKGVTKSFDDGSSARYGGEIKIQPGTNAPGEVNGVQYSGHAFDQTQGRGITPSAVDDAIQSGTASVGADGSTVYYSSANDLSVVANSNGRIITIGYGQFKPR